MNEFLWNFLVSDHLDVLSSRIADKAVLDMLVLIHETIVSL